MKISFEDAQSVRETVKLAVDLLSAATGMYFIIRKGIEQAKTLDKATKEELLQLLEESRLPDWDDLGDGVVGD